MTGRPLAAADSAERDTIGQATRLRTTNARELRFAVNRSTNDQMLAFAPNRHGKIDQISMGSEIKVGTPLVSGATVKATVVAHGKHDKVRIFKMRRRKHYQKRQGHRQQFTELQIGAIAA